MPAAFRIARTASVQCAAKSFAERVMSLVAFMIVLRRGCVVLYIREYRRQRRVLHEMVFFRVFGLLHGKLAWQSPI